MDQNIFQTVYKVNHAGGSGSCFYLKKHDLFVTNYHVVEGFRQVALEDNQKNRYLANIVLVNPILDIALLSALVSLLVVIATTSPFWLNIGPPLLPGLTAASVWI